MVRNSRRPRGTKVQDDHCVKTFAVFKCLRDNCGKSWTSFHGWKVISMYFENCKKCGKSASPKGLTKNDIPFVVNVFVCQKCDITTQSLGMTDVVDNPTSHCPKCEDEIEKSGEQQRVGKKLTFNCCGENWVSPYFVKEYTQRCSKCYNKGEIVGTKVVEPHPEDSEKDAKEKNRGAGMRFGGGGTHDVECCDMCQELLRKGIRKNCRSVNAVHIREIIKENGELETSVQSVQGGPPPGRPPRVFRRQNRPSQSTRNNSSPGCNNNNPSNGNSNNEENDGAGASSNNRPGNPRRSGGGSLSKGKPPQGPSQRKNQDETKIPSLRFVPVENVNDLPAKGHAIFETTSLLGPILGPNPPIALQNGNVSKVGTSLLGPVPGPNPFTHPFPTLQKAGPLLPLPVSINKALPWLAFPFPKTQNSAKTTVRNETGKENGNAIVENKIEKDTNTNSNDGFEYASKAHRRSRSKKKNKKPASDKGEIFENSNHLFRKRACFQRKWRWSWSS